MAKRVLITTSTLPRWRGDSTTPFVAQFAQQIAGRGWGVDVLAPHAAGAKSTERDGAVAVRRYRYFWPVSGETLAYEGAVTKIRKTPGYAAKLILLFTSLFLHTLWLSLSRKARVINAHWIIPQGFAVVLAGQMTGKRVVVSVHGGDIFGFNGRWMRRIKAYTLKHADTVVVNSSATLKACQEVYDRPDYAIIPMGVEVERFSPGRPSLELRKRYGLGRFTVLFVGRLAEQKGIRYLLEALKLLHDSGADFKALIVGEGPEREQLEAYVRDNDLSGRVSFAGWVAADQLQDYYRLADVFVGPSVTSAGRWQEAFGLVFAEAQACGVPVVATDTGGIADVVEDGKTGVLVPERSATAIYHQLQLFCDHPERLQKMSAGARRNVVTKFSWDSVIDRYEKVLQP